MKKKICLALALSMLTAALPAALAEEFFAEEETAADAGSNDFFSEDFFAEEDTIEVTEDIPEAAEQVEEEEESEERSIMSVATDVVVTDTAAYPWAVAPYVEAFQTEKNEKPVDGSVTIMIIAEDIEKKADYKLAKGETLKYYVYDIGDDGIARQVAVKAPTTMKSGKYVIGMGAKVVLTKQTAGTHTYMVRAEVQTTVNKKKKLYSEQYGQSTTVSVDVPVYSTAWKKAQDLEAFQFGTEAAAGLSFAIPVSGDVWPTTIAVTGFANPITLMLGDNTYKATATVNKQAVELDSSSYGFSEENGILYFYVCYSVPTKTTATFAVTPKLNKTKGSTVKTSIGLCFADADEWKAQPVIDSAVQTGDSMARLTFRHNTLSGTEDVANTRFVVTGFKQSITLGFTEGGALKVIAPADLAAKSCKVPHLKVSTYEDATGKYYVVEADTKASGTTNFTVKPVQVTVVGKKTKTVAGFVSAKKSLKLVKAAASAVMDVKFGYATKAEEATDYTAPLSFTCVRPEAASFKVTVTSGYDPDKTESVEFTVADLKADGYTIAKSGNVYTIYSFAVEPQTEVIEPDATAYNCMIETFTADGARIMDSANCVAVAGAVESSELAPDVKLTEVRVMSGDEVKASWNANDEETEIEITVVPDAEITFSGAAMGGDNNFAYSYLDPDGSECSQEGCTTYTIDAPLTEGDYEYYYKVSCPAIDKFDQIKIIVHVSSYFVAGNFTYQVLDSKNVSVYNYNSTDTDPKVPVTVSVDGFDFAVTKISANAFSGNTTIKSIQLPNAITEIGQSAFEGCTSLASMTCVDK